MGGIIMKYFPDCYRYDEGELKRILSLVELIIVIAIMAVLIGVLAPQYLRYVEKSRVSADKEAASALQGAITTSILDPSLECL